MCSAAQVKLLTQTRRSEKLLDQNTLAVVSQRSTAMMVMVIPMLRKMSSLFDLLLCVQREMMARTQRIWLTLYKQLYRDRAGRPLTRRLAGRSQRRPLGKTLNHKLPLTAVLLECEWCVMEIVLHIDALCECECERVKHFEGSSRHRDKRQMQTDQELGKQHYRAWYDLNRDLNRILLKV